MTPQLYQQNETLFQWSTGAAYLYSLYELGPYKLITGVNCEFLAANKQEIALLDTGAELSVAGHEVYQDFLEEEGSASLLGAPVGERIINTRFGSFEGSLYRIDVGLVAEWGESLTIEGTFLFCEEWRGPTVLGFHGFLERIRFAIDPDYEQIGCIYFAET
ncbi:MAG: hypothetical protein DRR19_23330 [Candidatus Parabeggiatoa sp. nov. 1]|nr:MAG: hypothetical protein DRR19_23330 [Gammaproteobacteria bacterium]